MKPMEKIYEMAKNEIQFCQELECEKNENGIMIYRSSNGVHSLNLPMILYEYKQWMIKKGIVRSN